MYSLQKTTRGLRAHLNTLLNNTVGLLLFWSRSCCVSLLLRAFFFFYSIHGLVAGTRRKVEVEAPCASGRGADLLIWPAPLPPSTTPSCFKHGCSHQRQPCISEELLRTLQKLASGLSTGGSRYLRQRYTADTRGWDPRSRGQAGPAQSCSVIVTSRGCTRQSQGSRCSFGSTNLVCCLCGAYTRRTPSAIKNVCILNNLPHK